MDNEFHVSKIDHHRWQKLTESEKKLVLDFIDQSNQELKINTQEDLVVNEPTNGKRKRIKRVVNSREFSRENKILKKALSKIGFWFDEKKKPKKKKRVKIKSKSKSKSYYDKTTSSVRSISTPMGNKR
tara:strand:+ start:75 stop:458 length:384 start_codon:yes stop_codon:yes gene_type:complete